jgi:GH15 family glucan-1,4-alpha-glucosidase
MNDPRRGSIVRSIHVLAANQAPGGAFLATPVMPDYHYCWFRDGSYIARALDLAGRHDEVRRFHAWAARVIEQNGARVARAEKLARAGVPIDEAATLHTRYTIERQAGTDAWSNFQLDGFGTWLWAV